MLCVVLQLMLSVVCCCCQRPCKRGARTCVCSRRNHMERMIVGSANKHSMQRLWWTATNQASYTHYTRLAAASVLWRRSCNVLASVRAARQAQSLSN